MQPKGKNTSWTHLGAVLALSSALWITGCASKATPSVVAAGTSPPVESDASSSPSSSPSASSGATTASLTGTQQQTGYRITQGSANTGDTGGNSGPVRMARISFVQGNVSWRTDDASAWSNASLNLPLRQGAAISVSSGSKAEVQFDDGARMRLGNGTVATLQTMYSDDKGEFTEVKLNNGLTSFTLISKLSQYQIDTPTTSIKATGPAYLRVGVGSGTEVVCRRGTATVEGSQGTSAMRMGDYVNVPNATAPVQVSTAPPEDTWDQFCNNRDDSYAQPSPYVPSSVAIMSGNLANYGDWRPDPHYGHIWHPRGMAAGWRPYHDGHWTWVDPFGWTWVGDESWGWAPYHYGSWVHASYGWGWAPGPAQQYWSPAVVSFSSYGGAVAWVPLAPYEVTYPSEISFGFQSGNWAVSFGIGGAAAFYGGGAGYVVGRPWANGYINRSYGGYNPGGINNFYGGTYASNSRFVPSYGRSAFAITRTSSAGFGGRGRYQNGRAADSGIFEHGQSFATAHRGPSAFGPAGVRPSRASFTPNRSFSGNRPSAAVMSRSVVRSPLRSEVARHSGSFGRSSIPSNRAATVARGNGGQPGRTPASTNAMRMANSARVNNAARANTNRMNNAQRANTARTNNAARANTAHTNNVARANTARINNVRRATSARSNTATKANTARANSARTQGTTRSNQARTSATSHANIARTRQTAHTNTVRTNNTRSAAPARQQRQTAAPRQQRQAAPRQQKQSAPARQQRQAAPRQQQRQSAPARQQRQAAPRQQQRQAAPPRQQRQAAPRQQQRQAAPRQQRQSPPPKSGGGNNKKKGGG